MVVAGEDEGRRSLPPPSTSSSPREAAVDREPPNPRPLPPRVMLAAVMVLGLSAMVAWWGANFAKAISRSHGGGLRRVSFMEAQAPDGANLLIEATNRYGSHIVQESYYPWLDGNKLVEPYIETALAVLDPEEGVLFEWKIYLMDDDDTSELVGEYEGATINVTFTEIGKYTLVVTVRDADNKTILATQKELVYCRYVRRELRTLYEDDRQAFFDAAFILWNTTTEEGQLIYGDNYFGIKSFMSYHLSQAGARECDKMHDGLGFMTQHAALTVKFEKSLQAVNPAVALPYWDFTIESELIKNEYDNDFTGQWFEMDVFDDDMFGRVDPVTHTVSTGRWADVEIMTDREGVHNAYGLMRAPWNQNKDKGMTRVATFCGEDYNNDLLVFPDCELHYDAITQYNTFDTFAWMLPYAPHGPVHVVTGGVYNCDAAYAELDTMGIPGFRSSMSHSSFLTIKALWRAYLLECPPDCNEDTPQEECLCSCPGLDDAIEQGDLSAYIEAAIDPPNLDAVNQLSFDKQVTLISALCNAGVLEGDQLEAASPFGT